MAQRQSPMKPPESVWVRGLPDVSRRGSISCFSRTGKASAARTTSKVEDLGRHTQVTQVRPDYGPLLAQAGPAFLRENYTFGEQECNET